METTLPMIDEIEQISAPVKCPACGGAQAKVFFELPSVPVNSITLWASYEEAVRCPAGAIELTFCSHCGAIYNQAFNRSALTYDSRYDNSLHYSQAFQRYAEELADQLIARFDLHGKDVIEVGCGKGDFLALLCQRGGNRGLGFDPTYEHDRVDTSAGQGFGVTRDFYSQAYAEQPADFVCCRHVLEHISDPRPFLSDIRRGISHRTNCGVFFEVPNASFTLYRMGIWDIIYEHCFYYTAPSLQHLFTLSGFDVLNMYEAFGGQYLCLEAKPAVDACNAVVSESGQEMVALSSAVDAFAERYQQQIADWRHTLGILRDAAKRVALWGAGAKGATFLNALRDVSGVEYIVDVNPHKHGRFVPGTGQKVVAPEFLREYQPDLIVITNPNYETEIRRAVAKLDLTPEFRLV
jgi:SAM-dependent methyltransferase